MVNSSKVIAKNSPSIYHRTHQILSKKIYPFSNRIVTKLIKIGSTTNCPITEENQFSTFNKKLVNSSEIDIKTNLSIYHKRQYVYIASLEVLQTIQYWTTGVYYTVEAAVEILKFKTYNSTLNPLPWTI